MYKISLFFVFAFLWSLDALAGIRGSSVNDTIVASNTASDVSSVVAQHNYTHNNLNKRRKNESY
jgi:hypothetical protein